MGRVSAFFLVALLGPALAFGSVRRVRVPEGGIAPDAAVGPSGGVYLVYGKEKNAFFALSQDGGRTFSRPLRLNTLADTVLVGHERGPKIAVGRNGVVHVVWMDTHGRKVYYTRSTSGGKDFLPPRNLRDPGAHLDGAAVAADEQGNVLIVWLDSRLPEEAGNPLSLPIFSTQSRDNGVTFSKNRPVEANQPIRACSCCALKAVAGPDGYFAVAFRGAYENIRDPFVARIPAGKSSTAAIVNKVWEQEWHFEACPMSGPFLHRPGQQHQLWAAWMSNGRVYCAESDDDGERFSSPHAPFASDSKPQNRPTALVNPAGQVFFAWEQGRSVMWEIVDPGWKLVDSGEAGVLTANSKATGFVDREGNFCLVF